MLLKKTCTVDFRPSRRRQFLSVEFLEMRTVPASFVDPGTSTETAFAIGTVDGEPKTFDGKTESANDVDLFSVQVKAGQAIRIRIDDDWNGKQGRNAVGLRSNVNLYNGKMSIVRGYLHQSGKISGFDIDYKAAIDEVIYLGISAAGNTKYSIATGERTMSPRYMATGGYTVSVGVAESFRRFQPGVYVLGRDLAMSVGGLGTHLYLHLVPKNPKLFRGTRDLGDGSQGYVVGAHNVRGKLVAKPSEPSDVRATQEYAVPTRDFDVSSRLDFDTETHQVNVADADIDATITSLLASVKYYQGYSRSKPIAYPSGRMFIGMGYNSNSWAQSIVHHIVGPGRVTGNFVGRDLLGGKIIPREYFG